MKIGIVTTAAAEPPLALLDSLAGSEHALRLYVQSHATDLALEARLAALCTTWPMSLSLHRRERGLARSWNDGILESYSERCDLTLVVAPGMTFLPGALDQFAEFLEASGRFGLGFLLGRDAAGSATAGQVTRQDFGCFAFGSRAFRELGAFDENFFPAYLEDADYTNRVRLAGLPVVVDERILVERGMVAPAMDGPPEAASAAREAMQEARLASRAYYGAKWGMPGGEPEHALPWGRRPLRIAWDLRHGPYGEGLDRPELLALETGRQRLRSAALPDSRSVPEPIPAPGTTAGELREAAATVRALYKALLGREPDAGASEYAGWLRTGSHTIDDVCDILRSSDEYKARAGALMPA